MTSSPAPAFVRAQHVTFRGPTGPIFEDTTLSIEPGQRWAVVGPNGSGKSAFVAGLMGKLGLVTGTLRHPFLEGDARFADSVFGVHPPGSMALASMQEHRRWLLARDFHQLRWHGSLAGGRATVAQLLERAQVEQHNPFAVLDASEDAYYGRLREQEVARFELGNLLDRPVAALSNGELHRFVLVRALLLRPRLLFMDEPLAGLDAHSRERLLSTLDELAAEGIGVVIATEREAELPSGITHVARLAAARLCSAGPVQPGQQARTLKRHGRIFSVPPSARAPLAPDIPILAMERATVRHAEVVLLDDVSLEVAQGEHWALLGENGSGKSTLLSLVLADNPQVYANDVRVAGLSLGPGRSIWEQKAWLGWLSPELEAHYPPGVRAREVVLSGFASSLGVHTHISDQQTSAASTWLRALGLDAASDLAFSDLSPVDRRLALLARAAVHAPSLLLFDEPCQGLDAVARATVLQAIAAVATALSAAMIYVTHDLTEIPASVTKLLVLAHGRAVYQGPRAGWRLAG
jgi:molybdate transport system ATP-binding protein